MGPTAASTESTWCITSQVIQVCCQLHATDHDHVPVGLLWGLPPSPGQTSACILGLAQCTPWSSDNMDTFETPPSPPHSSSSSSFPLVQHVHRDLSRLRPHLPLGVQVLGLGWILPPSEKNTTKQGKTKHHEGSTDHLMRQWTTQCGRVDGHLPLLQVQIVHEHLNNHHDVSLSLVDPAWGHHPQAEAHHQTVHIVEAADLVHEYCFVRCALAGGGNNDAAVRAGPHALFAAPGGDRLTVQGVSRQCQRPATVQDVMENASASEEGGKPRKNRQGFWIDEDWGEHRAMEEEKEKGGSSLAQLCRDHPELAAPLMELVLLKAMGGEESVASGVEAPMLVVSRGAGQTASTIFNYADALALVPKSMPMQEVLEMLRERLTEQVGHRMGWWRSTAGQR